MVLFPKNKPVSAMEKCMVVVATHNAILKNGSVPTKSQLLLMEDFYTWYQIEA